MSWTDGVGIEVGESGAWVGRIRFRVTRLQRASPVLVMYAVLLSLALTIDLVSPADPTEQHSLWMLLGSACVVAATQLVPPSRQAVTLSANGVTVSGSRQSPSSYLTWSDIEAVSTGWSWRTGIRQVVLHKVGGGDVRLPAPHMFDPVFAAKRDLIVRMQEAQHTPAGGVQLLLPPGHLQ